jgi:hypothetical protein
VPQKFRGSIRGSSNVPLDTLGEHAPEMRSHLEEPATCSSSTRPSWSGARRLRVHYRLDGEDVFALCDIMCGRLAREAEARSELLSGA